MSVAVDVELLGLQAAIDTVMNLGRVNKRTALIQLAGVVESQTKRRIISEKTDPEGKAWVPLDNRYAEYRKNTTATRPYANNNPNDILRLSGQLVERVGYVVQGSGAYVGVNSPYAATHQFGDDSRGIPARAFLGISDDNEHEITRALNYYLEQHVQKS